MVKGRKMRLWMQSVGAWTAGVRLFSVHWEMKWSIRRCWDALRATPHCLLLRGPGHRPVCFCSSLVPSACCLSDTQYSVNEWWIQGGHQAGSGSYENWWEPLRMLCWYILGSAFLSVVVYRSLIRWEGGPGWKRCCCRPGCVAVAHVCACVLRGRVSGVMRVWRHSLHDKTLILREASCGQLLGMDRHMKNRSWPGPSVPGHNCKSLVFRIIITLNIMSYENFAFWWHRTSLENADSQFTTKRTFKSISIIRRPRLSPLMC